MALRLWLPCNGTTKNLGLYGDIVFPPYAFVDGYVGKAVKFSTTKVSLETSIPYTGYKMGNDFAMSVLVDVSELTSTWNIIDIIEFDSDGSYYMHAIKSSMIPSTGIHNIIFNIDSTNKRGYLYIDGVKTTSYIIKNFSGMIHFSWAKYNDIRYYDHLLSAKEIDIISRILIFRQKLSRGEDPTIFNNVEYEEYGLSDLSGFGHDLTVSAGLTWQTNSPLSRGSVAFIGKGYLHTPNINLKTPACTYTFWAKINDWMTSGRYPIMSIDGDLTEIILENGTMNVALETAESYYNISCDVSTLSSGWHFFAITFTGSSLSMIIDADDTHDESFIDQDTIDTGTGEFRIGISNDGVLASGISLYDFRIYATCLDADDINDLYRARIGVDNKGNLFAHDLEPDNGEIGFGINGVVSADIIESEDNFRAYKDHIDCTSYQEI